MDRRARLPPRNDEARRAPSAAFSRAGYVDEWLDQPYVEVVEAGAGHWPLLKKLLLEVGSAGNLTSDAHLAALAIEGGCELASTDHDFARFSGLRLVNPLAADDD